MNVAPTRSIHPTIGLIVIGEIRAAFSLNQGEMRSNPDCRKLRSMSPFRQSQRLPTQAALAAFSFHPC
jgi:hypothetical protein